MVHALDHRSVTFRDDLPLHLHLLAKRPILHGQIVRDQLEPLDCLVGRQSRVYRIHIGGKVVAYSGDTEPTAPLDKLVDGADVAIVEATGPGDIFSHMSWENAAKLRKRHPETRFFFNHVYSGTTAGAVKDLQVIEV